MIAGLRRERGRLTETVTRLQASQDVLDTLLVAAMREHGNL
ncbi:hypothetical protein [Microtetraspora sp. NBRC 13810]|nr:hypothetical protein [Microtetraspora sp. NBRC 13810]